MTRRRPMVLDAYPEGALTKRFKWVREFVPAAQTKNTSPPHSSQGPYLRGLAGAIGLEARPSNETSRNFEEVLQALSEFYRISLDTRDVAFWRDLALALMFHHVPALQKRRKLGAPTMPLGKKFEWLFQVQFELARSGKAKANTTTFRSVAKRLKILDKNENPSAPRVRGYYRRATEAFRSLPPEEQRRMSARIDALVSATKTLRRK